MTCWKRAARLALFVIGSLATSAVAQPPAAPNKQPTPAELASARAHFEAAEAAKARRDYKTAAIEYLAAHELYPDPEFFFDIGEVDRLAGDAPGALTAYQKYLDLDPGGRGAEAARTAVEELQRSIAAEQAAAPPPPAPPPPPPARGWYRDPIALGLLGSGVAAIGVGAGFLIAARSADHDAKTAATYPEVQAAGNRASQRGTVGSITGGVGVALVGGGLAWIFLHSDAGEPPTVTGWLAPGGGGLVITAPL